MNRPVLFILLLLFWLALTWPADLGPAYWQDVVTGIVMAWLVTWVMSRPDAGGVGRWLDPRRYLWAVVYAFVLAAYIVKANVEVAYRVLHPAMPIRPGIVKIHTRLQRPSSRTVLSNSITLTPGTLTVEMRDDGVMMVHWIYVRSVEEAEAGRQIIGRFEWFIERIFE